MSRAGQRVTGRVQYGDRTRPVLTGELSDRTRPVATPDVSGVNLHGRSSMNGRPDAGCVRSWVTGRVRSGLGAYWTRPDAAALRPIMSASASGASIRSDMLESRCGNG